MSTTAKPKHIGRNISRLRELRGMKQEALAMAMGVSQQSISNLEKCETLEDHKLAEVAKALGVSVEAIENFSEESVINYFNNIHDNEFHNSQGPNIGATCTFNPLDKVVELYERMLEMEREKIKYLEGLLQDKNFD